MMNLVALDKLKWSVTGAVGVVVLMLGWSVTAQAVCTGPQCVKPPSNTVDHIGLTRGMTIEAMAEQYRKAQKVVTEIGTSAQQVKSKEVVVTEKRKAFEEASEKAEAAKREADRMKAAGASSPEDPAIKEAESKQAEAEEEANQKKRELKSAIDEKNAAETVHSKLVDENQKLLEGLGVTADQTRDPNHLGSVASACGAAGNSLANSAASGGGMLEALAGLHQLLATAGPIGLGILGMAAAANQDDQMNDSGGDFRWPNSSSNSLDPSAYDSRRREPLDSDLDDDEFNSGSRLGSDAAAMGETEVQNKSVVSHTLSPLDSVTAQSGITAARTGCGVRSNGSIGSPNGPDTLLDTMHITRVIPPASRKNQGGLRLEDSSLGTGAIAAPDRRSPFL